MLRIIGKLFGHLEKIKEREKALVSSHSEIISLNENLAKWKRKRSVINI